MSIWDEKPKQNDVESIEGIYDEVKMDVWLEKLHCDFQTLEDYKRWWLELNDLLREYLVDCTDADIIFAQIKDFKEKAEAYDKMRREDGELIVDLIDASTKLKAIKEGLPNLSALGIAIRDAEYILKVLKVVEHEVRSLATSTRNQDEQ